MWLGRVRRFPRLPCVMLLLSCDLKRRRGSDFIACSVLFADYFPKMLSRISIACDETSRQVLPCTEEAAQVGTVPPGIRVLVPRSVSVEYGLTRTGMDPGDGGRILGCAALSTGGGLGLRRSCAGCAVPSLQPYIQRFLWEHRCSALHVQAAMASLISICRERCGSWGLDGGQGNSPCVRWQRRATEKENGRGPGGAR